MSNMVKVIEIKLVLLLFPKLPQQRMHQCFFLGKFDILSPSVTLHLNQGHQFQINSFLYQIRSSCKVVYIHLFCQQVQGEQ